MSPRLVGALVLHAAAIAAANWATATFGLVPVGFGLLVTAGTFAAGFAFLARDLVHRLGGLRWALVGLALGVLLSWILSTPALALASAVAFALAELADLAVFARLRRRGFVRAAAASNAVAAPIDTIAFLVLAGFPVTAPTVVGQLIGKLVWATALPLAIYVLARGRRRVA